MSLFPGNTRLADGRFILDNAALENSLALAMEEELEQLYPQLKGMPMPVQGRDDRRLLFVAIARGMLKYLKAHEEAVVAASDGDEPHTHAVTFDVTMGSHGAH